METLKNTIDDIQHAAGISVHYLDVYGNFHWSSETYNIIDRDPRPGDEDRNIILELMDSEWADSLREGLSASGSGNSMVMVLFQKLLQNQVKSNI